jgi:hypothetical protein
MPISFKIYEDREFFLSTWSGVISDSDLLSSYKQLLEDDNFQPGFHELIDLRNTQTIDATAEGYRQLSTMVEGHVFGQCDGFKTAVIAPKDHLFGMSRMYEMISDGNTETVMVFKDPNEAVKWLGIDDVTLE